MIILLLWTIFSPCVIYSQISITISRYTIVYIFTNQQTINEVFFDHKDKKYQTNKISTMPSIISNPETTTLSITNIKETPTYTNNTKRCSYKNTFTNSNTRITNKTKTKGSYRFNTLKRTYLSNTSIPFKTNRNGTVIGGLWYDHFTDTYFTNLNKLQIDHIFPKSVAKALKGNTWTSEQFNNSPLYSELLPVYGGENNKKNNCPPSRYLPPNKKFQKIFKDMWNHVTNFYDLETSP